MRVLGPGDVHVFEVPVEPSRVRGRWGMALVSAAGPAVNLVLSIFGVVSLVLWVRYAGAVQQPLNDNIYMFLRMVAVLNLVLMLFNLLPVYPLDGGRILGEIHPPYQRFAESENGRWVMLGGFMLAFFIVGRQIFTFGFGVIDDVSIFLLRMLP